MLGALSELLVGLFALGITLVLFYLISCLIRERLGMANIDDIKKCPDVVGVKYQQHNNEIYAHICKGVVLLKSSRGHELLTEGVKLLAENYHLPRSKINELFIILKNFTNAFNIIDTLSRNDKSKESKRLQEYYGEIIYDLEEMIYCLVRNGDSPSVGEAYNDTLDNTEDNYE